MEAADKRHGTGYVNITVKDGKHSWNYKVESCIKLGLWNYSPEFANVQYIEHPATGWE